MDVLTPEIQKTLVRHLRMNNLIIIEIIPILMLTIPNIYATVEYPYRIDCDENGDHSWCNGAIGRNGIPFCDLDIRPGSCYDRNDNPQDYCEQYGESDKDFCEIIEG